MFDYLDNAVIKLCDMTTVGTDLGTVKQQIEELKVRNANLFLTHAEASSMLEKCFKCLKNGHGCLTIGSLMSATL